MKKGKTGEEERWLVELASGCTTTTQTCKPTQEHSLVERSKENHEHTPEETPTRQDTGEMGS